MRAVAVAVLASAQGRGDVSELLTRLACNLESGGAADMKQAIFAELDRAADLLS
jgi:hypothetical protein